MKLFRSVLMFIFLTFAVSRAEAACLKILRNTAIALSALPFAADPWLRVKNRYRSTNYYAVSKDHRVYRVPVTDRTAYNYFRSLGLWALDLSSLKILDVGAGSSQFPSIVNKVCARTGTEVHAIDANTRPSGPFSVQSRAEDLPYPDDFFDLIVMNYFPELLFEHTYGPEILDELLRVAKPGAQMRLSLENADFQGSGVPMFLADHESVLKVEQKRFRRGHLVRLTVFLK